ncbi:MAG: flavin reductase [Gloeobacteraceae cyanobacterium ES-bin-144]|nr:flavin reductase [Verrucomicrobiales bacterium]
MQTFTASDIAAMELLARVQFATSLPGAKPISLIGTIDRSGKSNLAPFSSILHLGSSPCLLGMVSRPDTVDRHTLANVMEMQAWTINHLHPEILDAAHQCSAKYPKEISEFDASGLTSYLHPEFPAPFVKESRFRIGLELEDIVPIPANGTRLIVGRVVFVQVEEQHVMKHGGIDLVGLDCLASTALDTYFRLQPLARLSYAKPDDITRRI